MACSASLSRFEEMVPLARALAICGFFLAALGCGGGRPLAKPAIPLTTPKRLCARGEHPPACLDPLVVESWLGSDSLRVDGSAAPPGGDQGTKLFTVSIDEAGATHTFRAKWRGPSTSGLINEPRKELAAYAVQKLFLEPDEYVAPPTAAHCFREQDYRAFSTEVDQPLPGTDCILGFLSLWLEDVKTVESAHKAGWLRDGENVWSPSLFAADAYYKRSIAHANLFMFAVNHGDPHPLQFILERLDPGVRIYVVDNSIAFRSIKNPKILFETDWSQIQVPAFPQDTLARIRSLDDQDFARLGVLDEFVPADGGLVRRSTESPTPVVTGLDWDQKVLRIGLPPGEVDLVKARLAALSNRTDLATF